MRTATGTHRRRAVAAATATGLLTVLGTGLLPAAAAGDEVHLDDPGSRDGTRQIVEGQLDADGELDSARVRRHRVDDGGVRVEEVVEEIDESRVPLAVRVQYELDGEPVTAEELRDAGGEAVIRIQLRNLTTETRTIEVDGEEVEVDVGLPLLVDGLLEFDDRWSRVRADAGRTSPAPDGGTRLRWSAALLEPVAPGTSEIEIRGDVRDASLPRLEVEANPATETSELLELLRGRATETGTTDAVAAFIAENLGDGLAGAAEGAEGLAGGLDQTRAGASELNEGLQEMQREIEGGFEELEEGLDQLDAGLAGIAEALARLEAGLAELEQGATALGDGLTEARDGARRLVDDVAVPAEDAVRRAWEVLAEDFTVGRVDPAYEQALTAVGELHGLLTGELPPPPADPGPTEGSGEHDDELQALLDGTGAPTGHEGGGHGARGRASRGGVAEDLLGGAQGRPSGGGPGAGADAAALDDYPGLAASLDELAGGVGEAADGARDLAEGVRGAEEGVEEIRAGVQEMRRMLAEAAGPPAGADADGQEMDAALDRFEGALDELAAGGGDLADGLRQLEDGGGELVDRLEDDLADANLDLAVIEALADRASERVDADDPDAVGGHDRYLLVFHEESVPLAPVAALAGLLALGGALEVLRRRVSTA